LKLVPLVLTAACDPRVPVGALAVRTEIGQDEPVAHVYHLSAPGQILTRPELNLVDKARNVRYSARVAGVDFTLDRCNFRAQTLHLLSLQGDAPTQGASRSVVVHEALVITGVPIRGGRHASAIAGHLLQQLRIVPRDLVSLAA